MFTGIVEELGEVVYLTDAGGDSAVVAVRGPTVTSDARHGDSISVNGVCLTVIDNVDGVFTADVMGETLRRSSLGVLRAGSPVNLERAATVGSRLGGHLVQGHVDGVAPDRRAANPPTTGRSCGSRCRPVWPGTWSRRARSPSTASR